MVLIGEAIVYFSLFGLSAYFTKSVVEKCCKRPVGEQDGRASELEPLTAESYLGAGLNKTNDKNLWNFLLDRKRRNRHTDCSSDTSSSSPESCVLYNSFGSTKPNFSVNRSRINSRNEEESLESGYEACSETSALNILERDGSKFVDSEDASYDRQICLEIYSKIRNELALCDHEAASVK